MNHTREHTISVMLVLAVYILAGCMPVDSALQAAAQAAPVADSVVMPAMQGATELALRSPDYVAINNGSAIAARMLTGMRLWVVQCYNGGCPAIPGSAITTAALSQYFNGLRDAGWQIVPRGFTSPLLVPITPELLDAAPRGVDG